MTNQPEIRGATFHRWRNPYGGKKANDATELCPLRKENQRLQRMVVNLGLQLEML
ncbi:MAG: transposase [Candidatus Dormibacteria bacterium]